MSHRPFAPLCLAVLLAGCGGQELRSAECDQGKPLVASGRISVVERNVSPADVSRVTVELVIEGQDPKTALSTSTLEGPVDFPLSFALCADLGEVDTSAQLAVVATLKRSVVRDTDVAGAVHISRSPGGGEGLELRVDEGCYCGDACTPICAP